MPIGTTITTNKFVVTKRVTRRPEQEQNNFFLELLKSIAATAISALAAKITGGIALKLAINHGLSNFVAQLISSGIRVATEFSINELYDRYKKQSSNLSTLLNLTPAIGEIGKITRSYRTTKILNLASKNKIINHLGITNANNLEDIIMQVKGKKIIQDNFKIWFNYTKTPSKETILNNLGVLARKELISNYKDINILKLNELLELETLLRKVNPSLVTKTRIFKEKWGNKVLNNFNTNINSISQMPTENWLLLLEKMRNSGIKPGTLFSLNTLRSENIFKSQFLNQFNKLIKKLKSLNPKNKINKYLQLKPVKKEVSKSWSTKYLDYKIQTSLNQSLSFIKKTRQWIKNLETKIESKIADYLDYKKIFNKVRNKFIKDGILLPLISNTFFAVKAKPTGILNDIAITIYYKKPESGFIGPIITTPIKLQQFLSANSSFRYYMYQSGWSIGWGKKKGEILPIMNFLPANVQHFYQSSTKLYYVLKPLLDNIIQKKHQEKDFLNKNKIAKKVVNTTLELSIDAVLGKGAIGKTVKNQIVKPLVNRRKRNFNKTIKKNFNKKINNNFANLAKNINKRW